VPKADNFTAICEPIVVKMLEPWDSFTFLWCSQTPWTVDGTKIMNRSVIRFVSTSTAVYLATLAATQLYGVEWLDDNE
jgi:hypothetical protein